MSQGRGQAVPKPSAAGASSPSPITLMCPGFFGAVAFNDITATWLRIAADFDLSAVTVQIVARTAPGTTDLIFDIKRSTNNGTTFATIVATGQLKLVVAAVTANPTITWTVATLSPGDLLRVDLTQADDGSCSGLVLQVIPTP